MKPWPSKKRIPANVSPRVESREADQVVLCDRMSTSPAWRVVKRF